MLKKAKESILSISAMLTKLINLYLALWQC